MMVGAWSPWLAVAMFLQMVLSLAFVVAVIWGIAHVISRSQMSRSDEDRAMMIARERYARGEIDDEEFEKMKKKLMGVKRT